MFNVYSGLLKMCDEFRDDGLDVKIQYLFDSDYQELHKTYNLNDIAGCGNDFDKAVNLLGWISSNVYHCGAFCKDIKDSATVILDYAFCKGLEKGINCRYLSIALTECLLAVGIKARTIYIMPFSPYDLDNHVVCEVWIDELNKWVMIDPTYNLYAIHNDTKLSVIELRRLLANHKEVTFNEKANYNGNPINKDELIEYFAKDLYWFQFSEIQGYDPNNDCRYIDVAPIGYDVRKLRLANIDFRIKEEGEENYLLIWRENTEKDFVIYKGLDVLY
jgi:hypothetical protein